MENTTTTTTDVPFAGRPLPRWYDDAKFGIFIHWGPYAVPCYAPVHRDMGELVQAGDWAEVFKWSPYTEWYLNSWAIEGSPTAEHHAAHDLRTVINQRRGHPVLRAQLHRRTHPAQQQRTHPLVQVAATESLHAGFVPVGVGLVGVALRLV